MKELFWKNRVVDTEKSGEMMATNDEIAQSSRSNPFHFTVDKNESSYTKCIHRVETKETKSFITRRDIKEAENTCG